MPRDDRMMATTYRFEINKGKTNTGQMLELARIQQHEEDEQNALDKKRRMLQSFRTDWNNNFDHVNMAYVRRNDQKSNFDELKILRRANLIARREALKKLFINEEQMYERGLNSIGLTTHKERI